MTKEERRIIAEKHFKEMEQSEWVKKFTKASQEGSIIYNNNIIFENDIEVINSTTENAIFEYDYHYEDKLCVLNFASFTRPGGGFIKGAIAQEEALCHASNLYNVLIAFKDEYNKNFNKPSFETGLYENWAIFSPNVYFKIGDNDAIVANVITCPAPNYTVYNTKRTFSQSLDDKTIYNEVLKSRIKYILDIAQDQNQKILVLGAFGCGVFGNDPTLVASIFKELLKNYKFKKVIFAIPDNGNGNYVAFKKVFNAK